MRITSLWRQLSASNRRWIITRALLATAAINVVVNAVIAWFSVQGQETVPLWGAPLVETSTFWNVVGTLFLLPMITCVLTTLAVRRDVRLGELASASQLRSAYRWLAAMPSVPLRRGIVFGAIAVSVLAPPLILVLIASGFPDLTREQFVTCQTAFAVLLGAVVTPAIALYAMADPPADPAS